MYTEDEARTKWCPEARCAIYAHNKSKDLSGVIGSGVNRVLTLNPEIRSVGETFSVSGAPKCMASACMAWRWSPHHAERIGYCGKAGKP